MSCLEGVMKIPAELKPYRAALGAGLFHLALGASPPENVPSGDCKSTRIKVEGAAFGYLESLAPRFGSNRQAVIHALAWVADQPAHRRALLAHTII